MGNEDLIDNLQEEMEQLRQNNSIMDPSMSSSNVQEDVNLNTIEIQIDTSEILSRIEHFLRGERKSWDEDGNETWIQPTIKKKDQKGEIVEVPNEELIFFNDYGVDSFMSIISFYIDKSTILSFYDEKRIYEILADLGDSLNEYLFCNYEKMGMDTEFKRTKYKLIIINVLNIIESTYRRALKGKAANDLNTSKIFQQVENTNREAVRQQSKGFKLFHPKSW